MLNLLKRCVPASDTSVEMSPPDPTRLPKRGETEGEKPLSTGISTIADDKSPAGEGESGRLSARPQLTENLML